MEQKMEQKINIVELLKDCPKGMELDCTNYAGIVTLEEIYPNSLYPIKIKIKYDEDREDIMTLTEYGQTCRTPYNKCVIFPKGKTTWEGFQRPFKNGDILVEDSCIFIIHKLGDNRSAVKTYCTLYDDGEFDDGTILYFDIDSTKLATEEEKEKLFKAIKENGYKWNPETKTLEKLIEPQFKVGDRITNGKISIIIGYIDDDYYYEIGGNISKRIFIKTQDAWKLVLDKFDITTLKPFKSEVLVRQLDTSLWKPATFGFFNNEFFYVSGGNPYKQCIPYEGNEHLMGTTDACSDYFKTWE